MQVKTKRGSGGTGRFLNLAWFLSTMAALLNLGGVTAFFTNMGVAVALSVFEIGVVRTTALVGLVALSFGGVYSFKHMEQHYHLHKHGVLYAKLHKVCESQYSTCVYVGAPS